MEDTFIIKDRPYEVSFKNEGLTWRDTTTNTSELVPLAEILSCWLCPKGDTNCAPSSVGQAQEEAALGSHTNPDVHLNLGEDDKSLISSTSSPTDESISSQDSNVACSKHNNKNYKTFNFENNVTEGGRRCPVSQCCHQRKEKNATLCVEYCERVFPSRSSCGPCADQEHVVGEWRTRKMLFSHKSADVVQTWQDCIWKGVRGLPERPRHLVVIINPVGGPGDAVAVYRRKVAPLFARAGITTTVTQTTPDTGGKAQALEAASTPGVDGVVVMGGDGTLSLVLRGLLEEAAHTANIDINNPNSDLPQTRVRVGVIPTGTTNCTVKCLHGTDSKVTAVLHIIMGDRRALDVIGVYDSSDRLVSFATNTVNMGHVGAVNEKIDEYREQGMSMVGRLIRANFATVWARRHFKASIMVKTPTNCLTSPFDADICTASCTVCSSRDGSCAKDGDSTWVELSDEYFTAFSVLLSTRGSFSRYGLSPAAHLGDGCMDMLLVPKQNLIASTTAFCRLIVARDHLETNKAKVLRCTEAVINCPEESPWALDGEFMSSSNYRMRVHRQKAQMFGRGIELHQL